MEKFLLISLIMMFNLVLAFIQLFSTKATLLISKKDLVCARCDCLFCSLSCTSEFVIVLIHPVSKPQISKLFHYIDNEYFVLLKPSVNRRFILSNFTVFCMTRPWFEPATSCCRDGRTILVPPRTAYNISTRYDNNLQ